MRLVSVNVSEPREIAYRGQMIRTGIYKEPVSGRVKVGKLNVAGDGQADLKVHGGQDMAVYAYPFEHYADWAKELGRDTYPYGQFGENLTVEGLFEKLAHRTPGRVGGDPKHFAEIRLALSADQCALWHAGIRRRPDSG